MKCSCLTPDFTIAASTFDHMVVAAFKTCHSQLICWRLSSLASQPDHDKGNLPTVIYWVVNELALQKPSIDANSSSTIKFRCWSTSYVSERPCPHENTPQTCPSIARRTRTPQDPCFPFFLILCDLFIRFHRAISKGSNVIKRMIRDIFIPTAKQLYASSLAYHCKLFHVFAPVT